MSDPVKCVRLTQGDYNTKKVYNEDPLEVAKMFEDHGIRRLHVVDLDGAHQISPQSGLFFSALMMACSRPPPPTTKIFFCIFYNLLMGYCF